MTTNGQFTIDVEDVECAPVLGIRLPQAFDFERDHRYWGRNARSM